jgi:spore coat protein U-like protein
LRGGRGSAAASERVGLGRRSGPGLAQTLTVYGRVPAQSTPSPGTYADTVVMTICY